MKRIAEITFPFAVLAIILLYTYAHFVSLPYLGFYISYLDEITEVYVPSSDLREGSRLLKVNGESWRALKEKIYTPLFQGVEAGDVLLLTVEYQGVQEDIRWTVPEEQSAEVYARLNGLWWRPFAFWLAGTVSWFVFRPRSTTRRVLVYLLMLIALYLAALSGPVQGNLIWSVPVSRFLGCLTLPIFLHLHHLLPAPLFRVPRTLTAATYAVCALVGLAAAADKVPFDISFWFAVCAVIGSVLLLVLKTILQKSWRSENLFILIMFTVIFLPGLVATLSYTFFEIRLEYFTLIGAYLGLPALPGVYFLVALSLLPSGNSRNIQRTRRMYIVLVVICNLVITGIYGLIGGRSGEAIMQTIGFVQVTIAILSSAVVIYPLLSTIGMMEIGESSSVSVASQLTPRANRLVVPYLFLVVFGILFHIVFVLLADPFSLLVREIQIALLAGLLATVLTLIFYPIFREVFEHYFFGMDNDANTLIELYARRITTTLSLTDLSDIHVQNLLPGMLVRQAALLYMDLKAQTHWLYARGVSPDMLPTVEALLLYLPSEKEGGKVFFRSGTPEPVDWIRVLYPMRISGKLMGIWLLGDRDPDDEYSASDLSLLQAISNQTAIALSNILLTNQLQELYQTNIDQEEEERAEIARGLHDQVLNQLVSLGMQINANNVTKEGLLHTYDRVTGSLRELIMRLRTVVLEFGLSHAIHEMASQLMDEYPAAKIEVQLPHYSPRYDSVVENHIYYIVHQVCINALRHSGAQTITISGFLDESGVELDVVDDGEGFSPEGLNRARLIEQRRFGIIGIQERAELIRGSLVFDSGIGQGTRVTLHWEQPVHA